MDALGVHRDTDDCWQWWHTISDRLLCGTTSEREVWWAVPFSFYYQEAQEHSPLEGAMRRKLVV